MQAINESYRVIKCEISDLNVGCAFSLRTEYDGFDQLLLGESPNCDSSFALYEVSWIVIIQRWNFINATSSSPVYILDTILVTDSSLDKRSIHFCHQCRNRKLLPPCCPLGCGLNFVNIEVDAGTGPLGCFPISSGHLHFWYDHRSLSAAVIFHSSHGSVAYDNSCRASTLYTLDRPMRCTVCSNSRSNVVCDIKCAQQVFVISVLYLFVHSASCLLSNV